MINPFKLFYRLGFTPWEQVGDSGQAQISRLLMREDLAEAPYGKALDIGCGRGGHSIELARRGWEVTGIDFVPQAVRQARQKAAAAGVDARFLQGDATTMASIVGSGYRFMLDVGCFHSINPAGRAAYAREATAVAVPDAVLLLFAITGGTRRPLPPGIDPQQIEATFSDWKLTESEPAAMPPRLKNVSARWLRFQRR
jgi:cyclopropane fatty-acyl-phospholipid synthase-like methyltransferase